MIEQILDCYEESQTKRNRRKWILEELEEYVAEIGMQALTYKHLYEYLGMEKKSLYRYYPNINELIVDVGLLIQLKWIDSYNITRTNVLKEQNDNELTYLETLERFLKKFIKQSIEGNQKSVLFEEDYMRFIRELESETPGIQRYRQVKGMQRKNNIFGEMLNLAVLNGETKIEEYDIERYARVIYQSVVGYMMRYLKKNHDKDQYQAETMYLHIELLMQAIKK